MTTRINEAQAALDAQIHPITPATRKRHTNGKKAATNCWETPWLACGMASRADNYGRNLQAAQQ
ncbi:hypothetical protein [Nocardia abscessus]|uniref:hypothetical protein n=1 Tax=Nocardia abscessus TaxID=120957 RepID=UPI0024570824|nr:hypothetical protein [Nocardia abscessus]